MRLLKTSVVLERFSINILQGKTKVHLVQQDSTLDK
jgi:hypothetical protein